MNGQILNITNNILKSLIMAERETRRKKIGLHKEEEV